ncbi:hypothetical protein scyTo_0023992 [Scyliorhinus torazame]|uniref:Uncharacterized protein n=1 Tax=Scyliorhinus torazame TaxID=75743 RepID=A0A401QD37_SCYTO|nr:hypothetical protein [Scyliorhinus torazame]
MKEGLGTEAEGVVSGTSAPQGASPSLDVPQESQVQILETSPDSGDRSDSGQQGQSEHVVQTYQQEQNIGLVGNLDQTPNGSELPRGIGQTDDAQRPRQFVTILTSDERGVTELNVVAEPRFEKLNEDLMEKEQMIEQLKHLLKEKERIHGEESSKLRREILNMQGLQKKSEEQSTRLEQLEDSNKFLNETVEEMDGVLDQLQQTVAQKDHENMLLRKEQVETMATAQQLHEEELKKLKLRLGEHPKENNGAKWDADERLKIASEEQSILAGFQSKTELETGQKWAELDEPRSKEHNVESLNNSLEEKYEASQQKVKDLEMSVTSLQSEVNRLHGLDQSGAAFPSPAGTELKLEVDDGNVEEIQREGQIELVNPELERDERRQGASACSGSPAARLDGDLLELRESVGKPDLGDSKAQGETERAQAEVERLRARLVKLPSEGAAARRGQLQEDDEACKLENTQEGKAQGQLSSLAKENHELHADLQAMREQVSSLQRSMEEANADFEQGVAEKTAECVRQTQVQADSYSDCEMKMAYCHK